MRGLRHGLGTVSTPPIVSNELAWHPAFGAVYVTIHELPDDPQQQVEITIDTMRRYTLDSLSDPALINDVYQSAQSDDAVTDAKRYLQRNGAAGMRYVRDEETGSPFEVYKWKPVIEMLMPPAGQVRSPYRAGDCDDFAMIGAAHLLSRGVPCSFVTLAADPDNPGDYSHVYLAAYPTDGPWAGMRVALDLSHGHEHEIGWEAPNKYGNIREWPLVSTSLSWIALGVGALGIGALAYYALKGKAN